MDKRCAECGCELEKDGTCEECRLRAKVAELEKTLSAVDASNDEWCAKAAKLEERAWHWEMLAYEMRERIAELEAANKRLHKFVEAVRSDHEDLFAHHGLLGAERKP